MKSTNFRTYRRLFKRLFRLAVSRPSDFAWFIRCWRRWQEEASPEWQSLAKDWYICLDDRHAAAGIARGHYFLQDLWAAQRVFAFESPDHVDVGSTVGGFVAHVAAFRPVRYLDIRPLECNVPNLSFVSGSIVDLPFPDQTIRSLSSLHVIEHIGLGRYGDPVNPNGWREALRELGRVLAPGGQLLIGTPCGRPRVQFNAHRVFDPRQIIGELRDLTFQEFSLIPSDDATEWIENCSPEIDPEITYGCGLFRFTR